MIVGWVGGGCRFSCLFLCYPDQSPADRQTDRQPDKQTNRQTDTLPIAEVVAFDQGGAGVRRPAGEKLSPPTPHTQRAYAHGGKITSRDDPGTPRELARFGDQTPCGRQTTIIIRALDLYGQVPRSVWAVPMLAVKGNAEHWYTEYIYVYHVHTYMHIYISVCPLVISLLSKQHSTIA